MARDDIFLFISIFKGKPFIYSLLRLYNFMMTSQNLWHHVIRANSAQLPPKKCARMPMLFLTKNPIGIPIGISLGNWPKFQLEPSGFFRMGCIMDESIP